MNPQQWREVLEDSPTAEDAQARLTFELLHEVRSIKTLLIWVLVGLPAIALITAAILLVAN